MFAVTEAPAPAVYAVPVAMVQYAAQMLAVFVTPSSLLPWVQRECSWMGTLSALTVFVAAARHASVGCGVAVRWSPAVSSLPVPKRILTPVPGGRS